ncbi:MAG: hypothetical protein LJF06_03730 [Gemmatimonadetes bacterium]|nr:hypothetical protein [Gemmatimonadota bacterium]
MTVLCRALAVLISTVHSLAVFCGLAQTPLVITHAPAGRTRTLREVWFAQLMRKVLELVLRTRLRGPATELVSASAAGAPVSGYVMAICHSPWARLLGAWCGLTRFALVVAPERWERRVGGHALVRPGVLELRKLVQHLRAGGRAVVIADVRASDEGITVPFLGRRRRFWSLPGRLATCAGVPLLPVFPRWERGRLRVDFGPVIRAPRAGSHPEELTRLLLTCCDRAIRDRPALLLRGELSLAR